MSTIATSENTEISDKTETKAPHRLVTKPEVCHVYRISAATLDRLISRGGFPYMKIGSRTLFRVEDVEGYFASLVRKND
jgi:excisionase family DNA binding protein